MSPERFFSRRLLSCIVVTVIVTLLASACAVSNATITVTSPRSVDELAAAVEPTPTSGPTPVPEEIVLKRIISGSYESAPCAPELTEDLPLMPECGWLIRPLHGSDIFDVELPAMVFKSTSDDPAPDPVIYLHGGPGGGILESMEWAYDFIVEPFLEDRDVIVFDQRGGGFAKPDLRCDSPYQWYIAGDEDPVTYVSRTANTCAVDLRVDGIDLEQFSRQRSADDVMVLARELGYEAFNLHGSSWGGLLAYTVMQLHPEWVRTALLDSPLSIATDIAGSMPGSFQEAMNALQTNCDQDPACAARHGDIVGRYVSLFDQLQEDPIEILIQGIWPVELNGDELGYMLFSQLYHPEAIAIIPDMLADIENGNTEIFELMVDVFGWGWGMDFNFLTYMCTDIVPNSSVELIEAQSTGLDAFDRVDDAPDGRGHTAEPICTRMQVETPAAPPPVEEVPSVPTVVFSGSMDPITSRSSGEGLADLLPNGHFVYFDDLTHGVTSDPCGLTIALGFLDDPEAELANDCATDGTRPPFAFAQVANTLDGRTATAEDVLFSEAEYFDDIIEELEDAGE